MSFKLKRMVAQMGGWRASCHIGAIIAQLDHRANPESEVVDQLQKEIYQCIRYMHDGTFDMELLIRKAQCFGLHYNKIKEYYYIAMEPANKRRRKQIEEYITKTMTSCAIECKGKKTIT